MSMHLTKLVVNQGIIFIGPKQIVQILEYLIKGLWSLDGKIGTPVFF